MRRLHTVNREISSNKPHNKHLRIHGFRERNIIHTHKIQFVLFHTCKQRNNTYINSWSEIQLIPLLVGEVEKISELPPLSPT